MKTTQLTKPIFLPGANIKPSLRWSLLCMLLFWVAIGTCQQQGAKVDRTLPDLTKAGAGVVLLGDQDIVRGRNLRQTPEADAQGQNRYERGLSFFETARQLSDDNNITLGWTQQTVPGVAHNNGQIAPAAAQFLYGKK